MKKNILLTIAVMLPMFSLAQNIVTNEVNKIRVEYAKALEKVKAIIDGDSANNKIVLVKNQVRPGVGDCELKAEYFYDAEYDMTNGDPYSEDLNVFFIRVRYQAGVQPPTYMEYVVDPKTHLLRFHYLSESYWEDDTVKKHEVRYYFDSENDTPRLLRRIEGSNTWNFNPAKPDDMIDDYIFVLREFSQYYQLFVNMPPYN